MALHLYGLRFERKEMAVSYKQLQLKVKILCAVNQTHITQADDVIKGLMTERWISDTPDVLLLSML